MLSISKFDHGDAALLKHTVPVIDPPMILLGRGSFILCRRGQLGRYSLLFLPIPRERERLKSSDMRTIPPFAQSIATLCVVVASLGMSACVTLFEREEPLAPAPAPTNEQARPPYTAANPVIPNPYAPPNPGAVIHAGTPLTTAHYSEVPIASNFAATNQAKLQATQHWMRIADDAGQSIVTKLKTIKSKPCPPKAETCGVVYVKPAGTVTEFSRAFHNQLITKLVRSGVPVSKTTAAEWTAEFDVQPISFSANRPQYRYAGVPVELAPGVWAIRDVASTVPANIDAPPSVDALHWFRSEFAAGQTPRIELLVTVSVVDKRRYLVRASNAYYITDADKKLYEAEMCSLFKLCAADGSTSLTPARKPVVSKTFEVVGDKPATMSAKPRTVKPVAVAKPAEPVADAAK